MAEYDWTTVSKHNIPVAEFKRLEPVMTNGGRLVELQGRSYHVGDIEVESGKSILVIQLFSEDINDE